MIASKQAEKHSDGLQLRHVRKSYGGNVVIPDLNFEVGRGRLLSLLGPSGCGKTTTLNAIAGFTELDSGQVLLQGADITKAPPNKRDTAIVFQNYALFPHMTVYENVGYGLRARKLPKADIRERVGTMLELLGISAMEHKYPRELSGGQQQRVSLARAIAVHPSLLLLDEPLSNLDANLRQEIRLEIRRLQQELSQTAVFVTHDQEEALVISDEIAVLNRGHLEQQGSPQEVWERPRTPYVANFMGVENIFEVGNEVGRLRFRQGDGLGVAVPLDANDQTHVGFRPSSARIVPVDWEAPHTVLELAGKLLSFAYLGGSCKYTCRLAGQDQRLIQVDQPTSERTAVPGEDVKVIVEPRDLLSLVASATAATSTDSESSIAASQSVRSYV